MPEGLLLILSKRHKRSANHCALMVRKKTHACMMFRKLTNVTVTFRCGTKKNIDDAGDSELKEIVKTYFDKWYNLEGEMFFLQREVILRDLQINELNMSVSDMKGKFIKPTLKKVSKYENKFAKLQEKAAKFAFANQLKAKDK